MITKNTLLKKILSLADKCPEHDDCKACGKCCQFGSGCMTDDQIPKIAKHLHVSEKELKKKFLEQVHRFGTILWRPNVLKGDKPFGPCIFYKKGKGCTIHEVKPLQCMTGSWNEHSEKLLQWFYLNYCVNPKSPISMGEWTTYCKGKEIINGGKPDEIQSTDD